MCVCKSIYTYVYIHPRIESAITPGKKYACMHVYACSRICMQILVCVHTSGVEYTFAQNYSECICQRICMYVCMHITSYLVACRICVCMHTSLYTCILQVPRFDIGPHASNMYSCMYVCMYITPYLVACPTCVCMYMLTYILSYMYIAGPSL